MSAASAIKTVRSTLASVAGLTKNVAVRDLNASFACTVGIGSEVWNTLTGQARPLDQSVHDGAELGLQVAGEQKLHLRRILAAWGPGVCWQYASVRPKKVEWKQPGARGAGTDRAAKASAVVRTTEGGEKVVNVLESLPGVGKVKDALHKAIG